MNASYYDIQKTFVRGLAARDIAEPLPSFDATTPASVARATMQARSYQVAGVRENGWITGYIEPDILQGGVCGEYSHPFDNSILIEDSDSLSEVVMKLKDSPRIFVKALGVVSGLITRLDLQDPPVRMWLFGLITVIELSFLTLIELRFQDDSWQGYLSPARLQKAQDLQKERRRRDQDPRLLDCLQFSDKAQIVVRDENLRKQVGFESRRRGDQVIKNLEKLRNNLAHSQDIVTFDWETIVQMVENLEVVLQFVRG